MLATIVAIEGADKCGKQTQSLRIRDVFAGAGYKAKVVEVPVNDRSSYKLIYWMLGNGLAKTYPNIFQFVQFWNKLIFQFTYLIFLRLFYDIIIFDRWKLSGMIYGSKAGANKLPTLIYDYILVQPFVTFVLSGRKFNRKTTVDDSYEKDQNLQDAVTLAYVEWANMHPDDHMVIDNTRGLEIITNDLIWEIQTRLYERGAKL